MMLLTNMIACAKTPFVETAQGCPSLRRCVAALKGKTAPVCKILSLTAQKMRNLVIVFELVLLRKAVMGAVDSAILSRVQLAFRHDILTLKYTCRHAMFATKLLT